MQQSTEKNKKDLQYIFGIRGIAAILVVFCHISCVFLPGLYYLDKANSFFEKLWLLSPLNIFTNGNAAVQCFFVLSGFLITRKIYNKQKPSQPLNTYNKLLRVVIPGIIFSATLMSLGLMFHLKAMHINNTLAFVNTYNNFSVTFFNVLKDIFFSSFVKGSIYVGPFWTITHEFFGAVLITAISYYGFENIKNRKLYFIILGIIFFFMNQMLFPFISGAFIYECIYSKELKEDNSFINKFIYFVCNNRLLLFLLFLVGIYLFTTNSYVSSIWKPFNFLPPGILRSLGFSICLYYIHQSNILKYLLSSKPLHFLGKISAYIYAFHWPIILSLGCGLYLLLQNISYYLAVLIITIAVLIASILLSYMYVKLYPKVEMYIKTKFIIFINNHKKTNKN